LLSARTLLQLELLRSNLHERSSLSQLRTPAIPTRP
jgi:hypothetical protein